MQYSLTVPFGLPGQGMLFGLDPLSCFFSLSLIPQLLPQIAGNPRSAAVWVCIAGMFIAVTGQDAFALLFGLGVMSAGQFFAMLQTPRRAKAGLICAAIANACVTAAVFLPAGDLAFALIFIGAGAQAAGVFQRPARAPLLAGAAANVGLYVVMRYALIVFGAAAAPWWGILLVTAGAPLASFSALRAALEVDLKASLAWSTLTTTGLGATAAGIALYAHAIGAAGLAGAAMDAALLTVLTHALFKPMLWLGAGVIERGTGTTSLDWLGGLMRGQPRLGMLMLFAASAMAALPPGPGFAAMLLLLHAAIAAAATGGIFPRIFFTALICLLGLTLALGLAAAARIIGAAFLGRPRSLRAAAAEDAPRGVLAMMALCGAAMVPIALLPGSVLAALDTVAGMLGANAAPAPLGYAPLPVVLLMAAIAGAAWLSLRRFAAGGAHEVPAWTGGAGKPPAWLPFGDPATQASATGLSQPIATVFAPVLRSAARLRLPARLHVLSRVMRRIVQPG